MRAYANLLETLDKEQTAFKEHIESKIPGLTFQSHLHYALGKPVKWVSVLGHIPYDLIRVLEAFERTEHGTKIETGDGYEGFYLSPFRLDLINPPIITEHIRHSLVVSWMCGVVEISVDLPSSIMEKPDPVIDDYLVMTDFAVQEVEERKRKLHPSERHLFPTMSDKTFEMTMVKGYVFRGDDNKIQWHGGGQTCTKLKQIKEIMEQLTTTKLTTT